MVRHKHSPKRRKAKKQKIKVDKTTMVAMLINQMSQALMEGNKATAISMVNKIKRMACRTKSMDAEWYNRIRNGLRKSKVYALIHNDEIIFKEILNLEREIEKRMHTNIQT